MITFKRKRSCFLVSWLPNFCSVGISYLHFLHSMQIPRSISSYFINKNLTNALLSVSCGLEAMDQEVKYSLIWTFRNKFSCPFVVLCRKKTLEISNSQLYSNYFFGPVTVWESTVDLFWRISSLSNRKNCAHITDWLFFQNNSFPFSIMITWGFIIQTTVPAD